MNKTCKSGALLPGLVPALMFVAAFIAFLPVLNNGFVGWDDPQNFLNNPHYRGLGWQNIRWMFTTLHIGHYQPLAWLTLGFDYTLWGMEPFGYHLTNLVIHALNAVLVYWLGIRLMSPGLSGVSGKDTRLLLAAGFSALFFALHPLRVESVAWVTERRDVLSCFFCLLTVIFYLKARADSSGVWNRYMTAAFMAYILSLLSKAVGMTFPVVFIILDIYPLKRLPANPRRWFNPQFRGIWLEKLPFLAAALVSAGLAYIAMLPLGDVLSFRHFGILDRAAFIVFGLIFYLRKTLAPFNLMPLYERAEPFDPMTLPFILSALALLLIVPALFRLGRRWPAVIAAAACYAVILSPMLSIAYVGPIIVADRYSYVSCISWAVLAGVGLWMALERANNKGRKLIIACAGMIILCLGCLSWKQTLIWRDSGSLWGHTLSIAPDTVIAHNNLASYLAKKGRLVEAERHCREALRINPRHVSAHDNLGGALAGQGKFEEAIVHYSRALELSPSYTLARTHLITAHYNLANILSGDGRREKAIRHYQEALRLKPDFADAHNNLGIILAAGKRFDEAVSHYQEALRSNPRYAAVYYNWGNALADQGSLKEAERRYRQALSIDELFLDAIFNLGNILARQGRYREAAGQYHTLLKKAPRHPGARENLEKIRRAGKI